MCYFKRYKGAGEVVKHEINANPSLSATWSAVSDQDGRVKQHSGKFQYFFALFRISISIYFYLFICLFNCLIFITDV